MLYRASFGSACEIRWIRKDPHAGHDGIPGENRVTLADLLADERRDDALARHPQRVEFLQIIRKVQLAALARQYSVSSRVLVL